MFTAKCSELPQIENGTITYAPDEMPDFDLGTKAVYQCDVDFSLDLIGNMTRECVEGEDGEGVFDGEEPICRCKEYLYYVFCITITISILSVYTI